MLQLTDSAFPTGAFAHSGGLEAAWQTGEISNRLDLTAFLNASLSQIATGTAPFVAAMASDRSRFAELDEFCDAVLTNAVANQASRSQGQALLAAATRVFSVPVLQEIEQTNRREHRACHLAVAFGAVYAALGMDAPAAVGSFLFISLRGLVSAAVRLGILGPIEGQAVHFELSAEIPRWRDACLAVTDITDVVQNAPLLDFYQSLQQRLYSRLFIS